MDDLKAIDTILLLCFLDLERNYTDVKMNIFHAEIITQLFKKNT
jgi:hypothetical protein